MNPLRKQVGLVNKDDEGYRAARARKAEKLKIEELIKTVENLTKRIEALEVSNNFDK